MTFKLTLLAVLATAFFFPLVALADDGDMFDLEKNLPRRLRPRKGEPRVPVIPIPVEDNITGIADPQALVMCGSTNSVFNGAEYDLKANDPCTWNFNIGANVQVDVVCHSLQAPCWMRHGMYFRLFGRSYKFCTRSWSGTLYNQVIRVRRQSSAYNLEISYNRRTNRYFTPTGMDCTLRGTGGDDSGTTTTTTTTTTTSSTTTSSTTTTTTTTPTTQPPAGTCGLTRTRIHDGTVISIAEHPWQVRLYPGSFLCGGTLISSNFVLTAAHCTINLAPNRIQIGLGCTTRNSCDRIALASTNTLHPQYNQGGFLFNDIAVLRVNGQVTFSQRVVPACLPVFNDQVNHNGATLVVVGWGTTQSGGISNDLKRASIRTVTDQTCENYYSGVQPDHVVCAERIDGHSCAGDSGGFVGRPRSAGTPWTVDGIVSFGQANQCGGGLGGYTETAQFEAWIRANTDL